MECTVASTDARDTVPRDISVAIVRTLTDDTADSSLRLPQPRHDVRRSICDGPVTEGSLSSRGNPPLPLHRGAKAVGSTEGPVPPHSAAGSAQADP